MSSLTEGQKLRITRLVEHSTLSQLAEKYNFTIAHLSSIETDRRSMPDVLKDEMIVQLMTAEYWYDQICTAVREKFPETAEEVIKMLNAVLGVKDKN